MFILKKGHPPGVYVPLRALFLVNVVSHLNHLLFYFSFSRLHFSAERGSILCGSV